MITLYCSKLGRKIIVINTVIFYKKMNVLKPTIHAREAQEFQLLLGHLATQEQEIHSSDHSKEAQEVVWFKEMASHLLLPLFTH